MFLWILVYPLETGVPWRKILARAAEFLQITGTWATFFSPDVLVNQNMHAQIQSIKSSINNNFI